MQSISKLYLFHFSHLCLFLLDSLLFCTVQDYVFWKSHTIPKFTDSSLALCPTVSFPLSQFFFFWVYNLTLYYFSTKCLYFLCECFIFPVVLPQNLETKKVVNNYLLIQWSLYFGIKKCCLHLCSHYSQHVFVKPWRYSWLEVFSRIGKKHSNDKIFVVIVFE